MISFAFLFFLVASDTAFPGELSLLCDSLSVRKLDVAAKGSDALLRIGVGVPFAAVPFVELVFATFGLAFAEPRKQPLR